MNRLKTVVILTAVILTIGMSGVRGQEKKTDYSNIDKSIENIDGDYFAKINNIELIVVGKVLKVNKFVGKNIVNYDTFTKGQLWKARIEIQNVLKGTQNDKNISIVSNRNIPNENEVYIFYIDKPKCNSINFASSEINLKKDINYSNIGYVKLLDKSEVNKIKKYAEIVSSIDKDVALNNRIKNTLINDIKNMSPKTSQGSLRGLSSIADDADMQFFLQIAQSQKYPLEFRIKAISELGKRKYLPAIPILEKLLYEDKICQDAFPALAKIGTKEITEKLLKRLMDTSKERIIADIREVNITNPESRDILINALQSNDFNIRYLAVYSLGCIADKESVIAIKQLQNKEKNPIVQETILRCLYELGDNDTRKKVLDIRDRKLVAKNRLSVLFYLNEKDIIPILDDMLKSKQQNEKELGERIKFKKDLKTKINDFLFTEEQ